MAISYPVADETLVKNLNQRLEEFRKLRVGYVDPYLSDKEKEEVKKEVIEQKAKVKKKSLIERFLFSDYE